MAPTTTAAATAIFSGLLYPTLRRSLLLFRRHPHPHPLRFLSTTAAASSSFTNTTASFDWSSDEEDDTATSKKKPDTNPSPPASIPPPFYDPFSKNRKQRPHDPTNLQEVFHRMRADGGLTEYAVKMFDGLSRDGLTHEALGLFSVIKDTSSMPDVVAHTAVLEAYADAGGHAKDLLRTFHRMLASGVLPNAYTYAVLVKGLAREGSLPEARRYLLEMVAKGMRPNVGTCVAVLEAYVMANGKGEVEGRALLEEMRAKGFEFSPGEKAVREALRNTRGPAYRAVMRLLFGS